MYQLRYRDMDPDARFNHDRAVDEVRGLGDRQMARRWIYQEDRNFALGIIDKYGNPVEVFE